MNPTIRAILALCHNLPDPEAHRHYLEQLPPLAQQQRLADLLESEQRHGRGPRPAVRQREYQPLEATA